MLLLISVTSKAGSLLLWQHWLQMTEHSEDDHKTYYRTFFIYNAGVPTVIVPGRPKVSYL